IPAEYRMSANVVDLPLAIQLPEPPPTSKPESPSFSTRMRNWFQTQPPEYQLIIVRIIPILILSLWVLNFFRKRSESVFAKLLLRMGMLAIVILSAYLCYSILMRAQAEKWIGAVPGVSDLISSPRQRAEEFKKGEADRLKSLEDIANQQ
ncbi:MAG: hypothetical protein AABY46_00950, partial [Nitrospirota bacterium]